MSRLKRNDKGQFVKGNNTGNRFVKGHKTWNKGMKGIHLSPASEFKSVPMEQHASWRGGVHKMKNDCTYVMIKSGVRKRRPRMIYEEHYGDIPKGFVIYHIDGDKDNDSVENLEAISRAELVKRNSKR